VVIGGLITATLLTLFVLPALYLLFDRPTKGNTTKKMTLVILFLLSTSLCAAQLPAQPIGLDSAIQVAFQHNGRVEGARLTEQASEARQHSAVDLAKTQFNVDYGNVNSAYTDTHMGISQSFSFPTVYSNQRRTLKAQFLVAQAQTRLTEQELRTAVRQ